MKSRIYFFAALVVLSLLLYMFFVVRDSGMTMPQELRLKGSEDIVQVVLGGQDEARLKLEQKIGGEWFLNDTTPADHHAVNNMLNILHRMEVRMPVSMVGRQEVIQKISEAGVRVDLYVVRHIVRFPRGLNFFPRKKYVGSYMLADAPGAEGSYVLAGSSDQPWLVHLPGTENGIRSVFSLDPHDWRSPVVISMPPERIKKIAANFPGHPGQSFQLSLDGSDFLFIDGNGKEVHPEDISRMRLGRFLNAFRELYHEKLLPGSANEHPADLLAPMFYSLKVLDIDGVETELLFFRRKTPDDGTLISEKRDFDPNRFYLKAGHDDYALALYFIFQPVIRPVSYFLLNDEEENFME